MPRKARQKVSSRLPDPYETVLADLRERRDGMDAAIAAIELLRGNVEAVEPRSQFAPPDDMAAKFAPRPAIPETPYDPDNPDSGEPRYV